MSKRIGAKINYEIETQFLFKKKLFYSGHHESANFPIVFDIQGTNVCFFNSVMQNLFSLPSFQICIEQSLHDNQVASFICGLLEDIKLSSTSVITST